MPPFIGPQPAVVAPGDLVVAYLGADNLLTFVAKPGDSFDCKFGHYRHDDLIGRPYGSKVESSRAKGFLHILHPTPDLWTRALPHRTQILYQADIAFISAQLELRPGAVVVEAGTGSGSFSHAIARTVAPTGHLHTFEYHSQRAEQARDEFALHGLAATVTVTHRDVCQHGFGLAGVADAGAAHALKLDVARLTVSTVFLDLPSPWEAVAAAKTALKRDVPTRICTFSPSIEQVQRNCDALRQHGFHDVATFETLLRPYELRAPDVVSFDGHLAQLATAPPGKGKRRREDDDAVPTAPAAATTAAPKSMREMRGHTSYLTFASALPDVVVPDVAPASET